MNSIFRIHWTSMNVPKDGIVRYWEIGTIFDFSASPETKEGAEAIRLNLDFNDLKRDTAFIVTNITDRSSSVDNNRFCRFEIKANVYEDGVAKEKCLFIGLGSAPSREACWVKKIEEWNNEKGEKTKVITTNQKLFYVTSYGNVVEC